jgi:hypothetical protein
MSSKNMTNTAEKVFSAFLVFSAAGIFIMVVCLRHLILNSRTNNPAPVAALCITCGFDGAEFHAVELIVFRLRSTWLRAVMPGMAAVM